MCKKVCDELGEENTVVPACDNSAQSTTISGKSASVRLIVDRLTEQKKFARMVKTGGVAFHSPAVASVGVSLRAELSKVCENRW